MADQIKGEIDGSTAHLDLERAVRAATAGTTEEAYWVQLIGVMQPS